jgi:hypothetical protein
MMLKRSSAISIALAAGAATVALFVGTAQGAGAGSTLGFVVHNHGTEYVTAAGSTSVFPGRLQTGDRIFSRDLLLERGRSIGYDNEICTVTFDNNDLCQTILVLPGKGQIQASWLWIGRNASTYGPPDFSGVIDGGTGTFAHAKGQFSASLLPSGTLKFAATLR